MKNVTTILTIIMTGSLVITVDSVVSQPTEVNMFPELKKRNNVEKMWYQPKHDLEGSCPVLCYCTEAVCYCCQADEVCCPEGCCQDDSSFCCPNGPYCCPPTHIVCCIESKLCCSALSPQCCPETCCSIEETCCGEECCNREQKCCKDSEGKQFCCAKNVDCCNDKCCTEDTQCSNEFNSEEQKMDEMCLQKPNNIATNVNENIFYLSNTSNQTDLPNPFIQIIALAVGQGDCTLVECPNGDLVIIDMGSTISTSFKGPQINIVLKDYFYNRPNSRMRIVVTHPDLDHYKYFADGLTNIANKVDYFILSGQYANYNSTFKSWLEDTFSADKINVINQGRSCFGNSECIISPLGKTSLVINPQSLCNNDPLVNWTILAANLGTTDNSQSAVIKLQYSNNNFSTVLFAGDFETNSSQRDIITHYNGTNHLRATIYKMAHHGASRLANDLLFLKEILPNISFVSQAYPTTNYAHPRCDAIADLLSLDTILPVDPDTNLHSPFACGIAARQPLVIPKWEHAIYATCREPNKCYHIQITVYSVRISVGYVGLVTQESDEIPDGTRHTQL